jgi:uncharacterized membrane protein YphA (DoxX/SURF4 family)
MGALNIIGRILFSLPFLTLGLNHIIQGSNMAGMVPISGGVIWIYFTGIAMILAGISILSTFQIKLSMILLALMLLIFVVTIHLPALLEAGWPAGMGSFISMVKDLGLAGGALILAALYGQKERNEVIK